MNHSLQQAIQDLFRRCPALCGFSVTDEGDFALLDLTCHPAPDAEDAQALLDEISRMLLELADEQPEAAELLRGRTFARTLH